MEISQNKAFETVCTIAREAMLMQTSADALEWDERTRMPAAAGDYRADQVALLRAETHRRRTDPRLGDHLEQLAESLADADPHSDVAATISGLRRDYRRDQCLPTELVHRIAQATVRGQQAWDAARKADDYSLFRDDLQKVIDLKREAGNRIGDKLGCSCYDALLDEYEPDARVESLEQIFADLRAPLVELIQQIADAPRRPRTEILEQSFDFDAQRKISRLASQAIGFDYNCGRLDETSHPFCTTLGPRDVRILTRYESNWLPSGLFGTLHEAGHGMYEQGLRDQWFGLPPGSYVSLGIHESQSRLWENQVGRSREFWQWFYPTVKECFPGQLASVDLDEFYFAINSIRPSLIRVEADEATYNLHILIRFDLERDLIAGTLSVDELPDAWNARYETDLGIVPPSDADGVLQDVHWSAGLIGYFPTYTLGNLASAQLFDAAKDSIGTLSEQFAAGQFDGLREWATENIYRHGRCYDGLTLVRNACGGAQLSAQPLIDYLKGKLTPLYGLS